jgi:hypothetical protein
VECRNAQDSVVRDRPVPLRVTLCYADDFEVVRKQEILKVSEDSRPSTKTHSTWNERGAHGVTSNGTCTIRVRVEEVTRRHNHRPFCFKV